VLRRTARGTNGILAVLDVEHLHQKVDHSVDDLEPRCGAVVDGTQIAAVDGTDVRFGRAQHDVRDLEETNRQRQRLVVEDGLEQARQQRRATDLEASLGLVDHDRRLAIVGTTQVLEAIIP